MGVMGVGLGVVACGEESLYWLFLLGWKSYFSTGYFQEFSKNLLRIAIP